MSNNAKFYDYFKTTAETAVETRAVFDAAHPTPRDETLQALIKQYGAVGWTENKDWGSDCVTVSALAFEAETYTVPPHVKLIRRDYLDGKYVSVVRGKLNSGAGIAFNEGIASANKVLRATPKYKDWVSTHFDVMRTGIGGNHPSGRGSSMLSSYGGCVGDVLVFAVVKSESNPAVIPECFIPLTYGEFYDLAQGDT